MSLVDRLNAWLRNGWRQLTSMRTALILLFLLAVAAIPGSLLPQRGVNIENVNTWFEENPELAPILDRLGGFDVYGSSWFSAIYLLLFVSLVGCVVPRIRDHYRSLRSAPVDAPKRLERLPQHSSGLGSDTDPGSTAEAVTATLRRKRWRTVVREHPDGSVTVSAEKGYLKETGNLLMHAAMVAVLIGVALGSAYAWNGNRLLVAGPENRFCNTLQQYDEVGLGTRMDTTGPPDFCLTLTEFEAEFTEDGQPLSFLAHADIAQDGGAARPVDFTVNSPLRLDGANVYLFGHGYAPILRLTDAYGQTQTASAPFLPLDPLGTAEGVAPFPDANVDPETGEPDRDRQVAFHGLFLPTAPSGGPMVRSIHPEQHNPTLMLLAYSGDLGIDDGTAQSVWTLRQDQIDSGALEQLGEPEFLQVGDAMTLPDGSNVEFLGTERWITLSVRHDPGEPIVLGGAAVLIGGLVLTLTGRRRRVWFRIAPDREPGGGSRVSAGGLPRSDYPGFADEFESLLRSTRLSPRSESLTTARST